MNATTLIIDHDKDIVMMLEDRLAATGSRTVVARDGMQAVEQVEQEVPNLVLLDPDRPRLTSLEVLKRLAKLKQAEDVPVIVMRAHGSIQTALEAMKDGACDFLTQPLDKDHLLIVIRKALERDSPRRRLTCLKSEMDSRCASLVGTGTTIRTVMEAAQRAAQADAGVL